MDTYENKQVWERTVRNAANAGCLDDPKALVHVEAVTSSEKDAMRDQNRAISRHSYMLPVGAYERIFRKGTMVYERSSSDSSSIIGDDCERRDCPGKVVGDDATQQRGYLAN